MKRVLAPQLPSPGHPVRLAASEADHATKVLRLRDGDRVEALDGKGHAATVTLRTRGGGGDVFIEYLEAAASLANAATLPPLTLELAILKGDAMEWVIEKAVELGVRTLIPTETAHTVVQLSHKGPEVFRQRWQKIADQALKQCGRLEAMRIETPMSLEDVLLRHPASPESPRLWCDEGGREELPYLPDWVAKNSEKLKNYGELRLLIGPEGGWSALERELLSRSAPGTSRMSLGPWVLRAETAAIFGISWLTGAWRRP
ncbi:MAG: 16S rRNA (uracil(1498)-N(3))-methyltransferase [Oligoflexia bacterium]|nr:16S rRNA (uracil(1498)-N(3))-methyltransferase [Oligoflexia bacterium]